MAGKVLADFSADVTMASHLVRPLIAVSLVGIVVGLLSGWTGDYRVVAAAVGCLLIAANLWSVLICAVAGVVVIVGRVLHRPVTLHRPVAVAAAVFSWLVLSPLSR